MAYERKLVVGAVNIKIHPHNPDKYAEMIGMAYKREGIYKLRGLDYGMIGLMAPFNENNLTSGFWGTIYRFINLNPDEAWLDLKRRKPLVQNEGSPPIVPDHLKPHLRQASFVFLPTGHRLFFDAGKISPGLVQALFLEMFSESDIVKKYGPVDVHMEKDSEAIESILSVPRKTELRIFITRPNPDDLSAQKQRVLDRLIGQGVRSQEEVLKGSRDPGIEPDADTLLLMEVANSNGKVEAVGYDGKRKIEQSTETHPLRKTDYYDPKDMTLVQKLQEMAQFLMNKLKHN